MEIFNTVLFLIGCLAILVSSYWLFKANKINRDAKEMIEASLDLDEESRERLMEIKHLQATHPTPPAVVVSVWKQILVTLEEMEEYERLAILNEAIKGKDDKEFVPPPAGFWSFHENGKVMIQLI